MKITVFFTLQEVDGHILQDHTAVVIDVLRATSSIVAALAAGAQALYPVVSTEDAIKLANSLGREDALLAGERKGSKVEGFDLGNSPLEFTRATVDGKRVVISTTNGTRALMAAAAADRVLVASFLNISAVAEAVAGAGADRVAVICAGREGRFSIDDALCAGMLLGRLEERFGAEMELEDTGRAALALAGAFGVDAQFLGESASGQALVEIGMDADLAACARVDIHDVVPELKDRMIRRTHGGEE